MERSSHLGRLGLVGIGLWVALLPLPLRAAAAESEVAAFERSLGEVETLLRDAHFHTALGVVGATRAWSASLAPASELDAQRARLEVLAATAEVALGLDAEAAASMRRALDAAPDLELDEASTSPKVLRVLDEARGKRPSGGAR